MHSLYNLRHEQYKLNTIHTSLLLYHRVFIALKHSPGLVAGWQTDIVSTRWTHTHTLYTRWAALAASAVSWRHSALGKVTQHALPLDWLIYAAPCNPTHATHSRLPPRGTTLLVIQPGWVIRWIFPWKNK